MSARLEDMRKEWRSWLVSADRVTTPPGLSTASQALDDFLLWGGLPQGALSLFYGRAGRGATSLWADAARGALAQGKWVAWVNAPGRRLNPWNLRHKGLDLSRLLVVSAPSDHKQFLWILQELMSLSLFELVGCDIDGFEPKEYQLMKLRRQARAAHCALVFISRRERVQKSSSHSLILGFSRSWMRVERALHRPTPHLIQRRSLYADLMPQLAPTHQRLAGPHPGRSAHQTLCG